MRNEDQYDYNRDCEGIKKHKQGVSSFAVHDSRLVFKELNLKEGDYFLDLGCGAGDYSIQASREVGESGMVYSLDKWSEVTNRFKEKINFQGIKNIKVSASDILCSLPVENDSIDVCLLATVLHIPNVARVAKELFGEIHRILKVNGRLAVIEIKKEEMSFGPPLRIRLSPEDTEALITPCGFEKRSQIDLGCNYMIQFNCGKSYGKKNE